MALRKIVLQGDECLTKVCRPVTDFNSRLHTLLDDMKETLLDSGGVGLAAPQVGILRKIVTIDVGDGPLALINPEIIASSGSEMAYEGCLSCPDEFGLVERPTAVTVKYQDVKGEWQQKNCTGLLARCVCHELDHLDGVLFIDKATQIITGEEMHKLAEEQENDQYEDKSVSEK